MCCTIFYKSTVRSATHTYMVITTGLMFIFITTRCIIDTYRCIAAFDDPDLNFGPPNSPLGILTNTCALLVITLADAFIIFRTFIVWERRWIFIVLPSLIWVADFTLSILALIASGELASSNATVWGSIDWLPYALYLTLSLNVICTGLISFRILENHRRVAHVIVGHSGGMKILSVIIESAAINTVVLVATVAVIRNQNFAFFVLIDCLSPLIGLVFSSIIIRVSRGTSYGERRASTTTSSRQYRSHLRDLSGDNISTRSGGKNGVQIKLERTTVNEDLNGAKYAARVSSGNLAV